MNRNTILSLKFMLLTLLIIFCILHIVFICDIYFKYPLLTEIISDSEYDEKELPAFTFCAAIDHVTDGRFTQQIFRDFDLNSIVLEAHYRSLRKVEENITKFILEKSIEILSLLFYCFTINSHVKSE